MVGGGLRGQWRKFGEGWWFVRGMGLGGWTWSGKRALPGGGNCFRLWGFFPDPLVGRALCGGKAWARTFWLGGLCAVGKLGSSGWGLLERRALCGGKALGSTSWPGGVVSSGVGSERRSGSPEEARGGELRAGGAGFGAAAPRCSRLFPGRSLAPMRSSSQRTHGEPFSSLRLGCGG